MGSTERQAGDVFGTAGSGNAAAVRFAIRRGDWAAHTSGLADDHVQGNVVILPKQQAFASVKDSIVAVQMKTFRYVSWASNGVNASLLNALSKLSRLMRP